MRKLRHTTVLLGLLWISLVGNIPWHETYALFPTQKDLTIVRYSSKGEANLSSSGSLALLKSYQFPTLNYWTERICREHFLSRILSGQTISPQVRLLRMVAVDTEPTRKTWVQVLSLIHTGDMSLDESLTQSGLLFLHFHLEILPQRNQLGSQSREQEAGTKRDRHHNSLFAGPLFGARNDTSKL